MLASSNVLKTLNAFLDVEPNDSEFNELKDLFSAYPFQHFWNLSSGPFDPKSTVQQTEREVFWAFDTPAHGILQDMEGEIREYVHIAGREEDDGTLWLFFTMSVYHEEYLWPLETIKEAAEACEYPVEYICRTTPTRRHSVGLGCFHRDYTGLLSVCVPKPPSFTFGSWFMEVLGSDALDRIDWTGLKDFKVMVEEVWYFQICGARISGEDWVRKADELSFKYSWPPEVVGVLKVATVIHEAYGCSLDPDVWKRVWDLETNNVI